MPRILGIDPGSRLTGFGLIDTDGARSVYVDSGCVRVAGTGLAERLGEIFNGISELVQHYRPDEIALERVFVHRNVDSALKLGQARGAALAAVAQAAVPVSEYSPSEIKQAVVGKGGAAKTQVQHMVTALLRLACAPQADAADALAAALCHAQLRRALGRIEGATAVRGGRLR